MSRGSDSGIFYKKRLYPKEIKDSTSFWSWSERFIAWIAMDNADVGQAFQRAGKQEDPLDVSSLSVMQVRYSKAIYGHLRALTENFRKAAKIVRLVKGDNGLEAWRRLVRKFDPQNAEVHAAHLEAIVTFGTRNCVKSVEDVPSVLDQFQKLLDDYEEVTGDCGINDSTKKTIIMQLLPQSLRVATRDTLMAARQTFVSVSPTTSPPSSSSGATSTTQRSGARSRWRPAPSSKKMPVPLASAVSGLGLAKARLPSATATHRPQAASGLHIGMGEVR